MLLLRYVVLMIVHAVGGDGVCVCVCVCAVIEAGELPLRKHPIQESLRGRARRVWRR